VLLRLAYLGVTNALALLRLLPMSDRAKEVEILALRHQIIVLERHLHGERIRFSPTDRTWLGRRPQAHRLASAAVVFAGRYCAADAFSCLSYWSMMPCW
jgi:hypothetical protein